VGSILDHRHYIERYLGAAEEDELSAPERRTVLDHVTNCEQCRIVLAFENNTRELVQKNLRVVRAPDALRQQIAASLDAADRAEARTPRTRTLVSRSIPIAAVALAATLAAIIFNFNFRMQPTDNPAFDAAIASYVDSEKQFVPTVGVKSSDELAIALINQFGVPLVWDFSAIDLTSRGGRIDKLPDGNPFAYSLYKGAKGSLLCIITRKEGFHFPPGDKVVKGIHLYSYRGYSVAATDRYSVFCVMVSNLPVEDLVLAFDRLPT
jgi:anti-sigma factor RsiW